MIRVLSLLFVVLFANCCFAMTPEQFNIAIDSESFCISGNCEACSTQAIPVEDSFVSCGAGRAAYRVVTAPARFVRRGSCGSNQGSYRRFAILPWRR